MMALSKIALEIAMDQIMGRGKDQIKKEFDPYVSMFSSFGGGVNETAYSLANSLNDAATIVSKITGLPKGNFFEQAAKEYMENANFWQDKEANYKLDPVTQMVTHAAGAAIPGITNFALGPVWAGIQGATEAEMAGNNPLTGAVTGGLERYITGKALNVINALSLPIRAPLMGATGAAQAAAQGGDEQDIANSFGEMALYGMMGPRGGKTAKDIYEDFRFSQPKNLANERGAIDMSGKKEPTGKTPSKPEGGDKETIKQLITIPNDGKQTINRHTVNKSKNPSRRYWVLSYDRGYEETINFPDENSMALFLDGKIKGLEFYNPEVENKIIPITKKAEYSGQEEQWTERKSGEKILTEPLVGYHHSAETLDAFYPQETAFYADWVKQYHSPGHWYRITVPAGKKIEHFGSDEFRVELDNDMVINPVKGGWNPYKYKWTKPENSKFPSGHSNVREPSKTPKPEGGIDIRSDEFKQKFGDWENPDNQNIIPNGKVSRVAENWKPRIVYHGTPNKNFKNFEGEASSTINPSVTGSHRWGVFFTTNKGEADFYARGGHYLKDRSEGKTVASYLDIKKPYKTTESNLRNLSKEDLQKQGYDGLEIVAGNDKYWYVPFSKEQIIISDSSRSPKEGGQEGGEFNEEFKKRFEGSKVVDENSEPRTVYHGTNEEFNKFSRGASQGYESELGYFFSTSEDVAKSYGKTIKKALLKIQNPFEISAEEYIETIEDIIKYYDEQSHQWELSDKYKSKRLIKKWVTSLKKAGYDGILIEGGTEDSDNTFEHDTWIAFSRNQISDSPRSPKEGGQEGKQ